MLPRGSVLRQRSITQQPGKQPVALHLRTPFAPLLFGTRVIWGKVDTGEAWEAVSFVGDMCLYRGSLYLYMDQHSPVSASGGKGRQGGGCPKGGEEGKERKKEGDGWCFGRFFPKWHLDLRSSSWEFRAPFPNLSRLPKYRYNVTSWIFGMASLR